MLWPINLTLAGKKGLGLVSGAGRRGLEALFRCCGTHVEAAGKSSCAATVEVPLDLKLIMLKQKFEVTLKI
jgi:hypothetical protein